MIENGVKQAACHAVADEAVPFEAIARAIGSKLSLPVEPRPREHFGWFANFAYANMPASSGVTRETLGWHPTQSGLLSDLALSAYYEQ